MKLWQLCRKYINRGKNLLRESEPIVELPYPALLKTVTLTDSLIETLVIEARVKCGELGYEIDHIYFFAAFDSPVIFKRQNVKARSDNYVAIYRRKDKSCFAVVFNGSWLEIK
jgi:hypothetical protein